MCLYSSVRPGQSRSSLDDRGNLGVAQQRKLHGDQVALDGRVLPQDLLQVLRHADNHKEQGYALIGYLLDRICEPRPGILILDAIELINHADQGAASQPVHDCNNVAWTQIPGRECSFATYLIRIVGRRRKEGAWEVAQKPAYDPVERAAGLAGMPGDNHAALPQCLDDQVG